MTTKKHRQDESAEAPNVQGYAILLAFIFGLIVGPAVQDIELEESASSTVTGGAITALKTTANLLRSPKQASPNVGAAEPAIRVHENEKEHSDVE